MRILDRSQIQQRLKALTLIELLVAFLLLAVVGGAFFYAFFLGDAERRLSRTIQSMDESHQESLAKVQKIINDAVRVNGFSSNLFPGIQNSASAVADRQNLTVRGQRFPEITASLSSITVVQSGTSSLQIEFSLKNVPASGSPEQQDSLEVISHFLRNPSGVQRPLLFINGSTRNVLPVQWVGTNALGPYRAEVPIGSGANALTVDRLSRELSSESLVSMVEEVSLEFTSTGEWQLRETFENPTAPKTTPLSSDVRQLQYFFEFGNHLRDGGVAGNLVVVPNQPLQKWDASDYLSVSCTSTTAISSCCNPANASISCVGPSDLASVRIDSQWAREFTDRKQMNLTDPLLSLANGELLKKFLFSMVPRNYALESEDGGALAVSASCMAPENRCKPGCSDYFNSDDRGSPRWKGYGMYVGHDSAGVPLVSSGYCRCGTKDPGRDGVVGNTDYTQFVPPDTPAGRLNIEAYRPPLLVSGAPNPANVQVNGCAAHFGDVYEYSFNHPPMFVWRVGLETAAASEFGHTGTGSNLYGSWYRTTNELSSIDKFTWDWNRFEELWTNYRQHPARNSDGSENLAAWWVKHIKCYLARDFVSSWMRKIFYGQPNAITTEDLAKVTAPGGRPPFGPFVIGNSGDRFAAPIEEKCLCRTQETPSFPNIQTREVCNHAANPTEVICPNTWHTVDTNGNPVGQYVTGTENLAEGLKRKIYLVNGSAPGDYTDALSLTQAARCQCLSETYNPPYSDNSDLPYFEGHPFSNLWDFRVDPGSSVFSGSRSSVGSEFYTFIAGPTGTNNALAPGDSSLQPIISFASSNHTGSSTSFTPPTEAHLKNALGIAPVSQPYPHASPYVRSVKVHYKSSPNGELIISNPWRCDSSFPSGYISKCTEPYDLASVNDSSLDPVPEEINELRSIRQFLLSRQGASGLTPAQIDAYLGYCRTSCINEQNFAFNANQWYVKSGLAWIRAKITGSGSINSIPTQCGGRIVNWVPQN